MAGLYAADGSWNMHIVDGLSYVGYYHTDGSINGTGTPPGPTGLMSPAGCIYVVIDDTDAPLPRQDNRGALRITTSDVKNGAQKVTFIP